MYTIFRVCIRLYLAVAGHCPCMYMDMKKFMKLVKQKNIN